MLFIRLALEMNGPNLANDLKGEQPSRLFFPKQPFNALVAEADA
jgi:hypothetical protein